MLKALFVLSTVGLLASSCTPSAYRVSEVYVDGNPQSAEVICENAHYCAAMMEEFCPDQAVEVLEFGRFTKNYYYWNKATERWEAEPQEMVTLRFKCRPNKEVEAD